mmetsp:Transcript_26131/g.66506  ORF Transcript_26131/g.66506 Transcript_26131/m.66506 type:complete len:214 (-) Transcript_26131:831-1472(-)
MRAARSAWVGRPSPPTASRSSPSTWSDRRWSWSTSTRPRGTRTASSRLSRGSLGWCRGWTARATPPHSATRMISQLRPTFATLSSPRSSTAACDESTSARTRASPAQPALATSGHPLGLSTCSPALALGPSPGGWTSPPTGAPCWPPCTWVPTRSFRWMSIRRPCRSCPMWATTVSQASSSRQTGCTPWSPIQLSTWSRGCKLPPQTASRPET